MSELMSVEEHLGKPLSQEKANEIIQRVCGWALLNGVQKTITATEFPERIEPKGFTLFPSIIPAEVLKGARSLQTAFQTLIYKAAGDHAFMTDCFASMVGVDDLVTQLWNIYETVRTEGPTQKVSLMLTRNDFMMEHDEDGSGKLNFKHVEINTMASSSGGGNGSMAELHRYSLTLSDIPFKDEQLENNHPSFGLARGLVKAWHLYGNKDSVIMFVVSLEEPATCDHRWIERDIFRQDRSVKVLYRTFSQLVQEVCLGDRNELIVDGKEVAVVYYRCGYITEDYPTRAEYKVRLDIEKSCAIKCPTVAVHLAGCKKVQQALAEPGVLERFVHDTDVIKQLRATFVGQYQLDTEKSQEIIAQALKTPERFVLKPQREGGANNLFGDQLRDHLKKIKDSPERSAWILMDLIKAASQRNRLVGAGLSPECRNVVNELGILGVHISTPDSEVENYECGYLVRTKPEEAKEGGLGRGNGYLDSIFLV